MSRQSSGTTGRSSKCQVGEKFSKVPQSSKSPENAEESCLDSIRMLWSDRLRVKSRSDGLQIIPAVVYGGGASVGWFHEALAKQPLASHATVADRYTFMLSGQRSVLRFPMSCQHPKDLSVSLRAGALLPPTRARLIPPRTQTRPSPSHGGRRPPEMARARAREKRFLGANRNFALALPASFRGGWSPSIQTGIRWSPNE